MNKWIIDRLCAEFLFRCLSMGWKKSDLDELERIWMDHEGWKHTIEYRSVHGLPDTRQKARK